MAEEAVEAIEKRGPGRPKAKEPELKPAKNSTSEAFPPYDGKKENLQPATFNKRGRVIGKGVPKYLVNRNGDTYKLIAVYANGNGVGRKMVRALHPNKKTKKGIADKVFLAQLKTAGVPGAI